MITFNTWIYRKTELTQIPNGVIGFVYCITNLTNLKKYIGKKQFYFKKIIPACISKGRKKRNVQVESDWQTYTGSCAELNADIAKGDIIHREILSLHTCKGNLSYAEAELQFAHDVLKSVDYYNKIINCRIHAKHLK